MRLADRYRLERRVGEGGGGGVYLVRDRLADDAEMVLKRLHAHAQAGVAQWLVNEFQILAQLDMPTVARVFDFGLAEPDAEDPGGPFFTREFVDGVPLDHFHRAEELAQAPLARLVAHFVSALETLRALHRLGVVHGDLKPANLIVPRGDAAGRVILIDFGLAHGALGAVERVRGGTLAFMPPERREQLMAGESLAPDPRADLYALAFTLLVLFGMDAHDAPPPGWTAGRADALDLIDAARRGASPDPGARYATADDFLAALTRGAVSPPPPARVVLRPEGRENELGAMLEHVGRRLVRREGGLSSLVLLGDEGSGRTTLLRELTWRAQLRGVQVLNVQGAPGDAPARRLREGAAVLAGGAPVRSDDLDGLVQAFRRAARAAPVLVLADDLDRADPAIAAMLRSIAYACEGVEPLLVVASAAREDAVAGLSAAARVALGPLDEAAVAALCAQILGAVEPGVVSAVHARTGGSPLAVNEMLVALAGAGAVTTADVERVEVPPRARDVARRRVAALPDEVKRAAAAVAALGGVGEQALAAEVAGGAAGVEAARALGVLALRSDGRVELAHGALADALLDALEPGARAEVFRGAAEALERTDAPAAARAQAWVRARDGARARAHLATAVGELRAAGVPLAAARLLAQVRELEPASATAASLLEEAELFADAGSYPEAAGLAERVATGDDAALAQRARLLCGRALAQGGELDRAAATLGEGLAKAADGDAAGEFVRELGRVDFQKGDYAQAARRCDEALASARSPAVRGGLLALSGLAASYLGNQDRAVEILERALALYAEVGLAREEARVLAYLSIARDRSGDLAGARALFERTLERARAAGDVAQMASARLNLGNVLERLGDMGSALDHFAAATKLAQRAGRVDSVLAARLSLAGNLIRLGSHERARAELDSILAAARAYGHREYAAHATAMLGVVRAHTGEVDAGLGLVAEAREAFAAMGLTEGVAETDLETADVLLDRGLPGDVQRASERVAHAREALPQLGALEARARLVEGRVALGRGDARGAQKLLAEAIELAEKSHQWEVLAGALAARAQSHRAMGAEIHARRDRERALEVLEATASILPPDLRSAFWSVPERVALRGPAERTADQPSAPGGVSPFIGASLSTHAPTMLAQDQRLMLLLELSRRVGEEQTLERVLDQAVRSAVELTNAERGAIMLVGPGGTMAVRARSGVTRDDGPDEGFSRSIAETVLIDGEVVATHNARGDTRFADFRSVHELAIGAVAAVPIKSRGRTLGVLYVENRLRRAVWSASDVALMRAFAEQAGIAVEHARLVEELEARSRELEAAKREIEQLLDERTAELEHTRKSLARAEEALKGRFAPQGLVAQTESMRKVFAIIERVRDTDVPVVIEGESGTGKELVARAIHHSGVRGRGPFVVVHCGAIPETLLESELFGHVRGAFTGADRDRKGLIVSAHGGTLMLDEVAEMPLKMQVELLRVLQEHRVRPVGSEKDEPADIRVLAATNRPLRDLVAEGRFREDLFYRLSVVTVRLPPLRARIDDIPLLASHFLARVAEEHGVSRKRLSREALAKLLRAPWPGNVRQLQHVLESAAVLAEGDTLDADQIAIEDVGHGSSHAAPAASGGGAAAEPSAPGRGASPMAVRKAAERQRILEALEQVNWNKVRAATVLGMPRRTLYRRLREYGLLE